MVPPLRNRPSSECTAGVSQPVRAPNRSNPAICGPSKTTFCDCDCDLCDCTVAMDRTLFANIINCMGLFPHKHIISPLVHKYVTLNVRNPRLAESIYGSDARQIEEGSNFGMYAFWITTIYGQTCVHACVCVFEHVESLPTNTRTHPKCRQSILYSTPAAGCSCAPILRSHALGAMRVGPRCR